jgi:transmembrane protein TMEM260 (protein O-mannosyltransferase)
MVSRVGARFEPLRSLILPVGVVVVVLAIIGPTVMPGLGFWDTGEFQTVPPILGTMHPTGYPTYVLLGFLVNLLLTPIGEPAYRMNVMSLLAVAAAAALAASTIRSLTGRATVGAAVGIGVALTPVVWGIATRADAHALHLAFVALLIALLVRWEQAPRDEGQAASPGADRWLIGAAVVFGLAAGNHSLTLLLALPIGLFVLAVEPAVIHRPRLIAACLVAAFGSLALVYLELPLRAGPFRASLVYADPDTWDGFWYIALAEQFRGVLGNPFADLLPKLGELADLGLRQLGSLAYAVPIAFAVTAARLPRFALLTGAAFLITVLFNAAYSNADLSRYYLGPVLLAWLWLGVLAATIVERAMAVADRTSATDASVAPDEPDALLEHELDFGRPRRGELGLAATMAVLLLVPTASGFQQRAELLDRSSDTSAARWLDAMFETLPENSVVVTWWSYSTALWYGQHVEGRRPDIMIIDDRTLLDLHFGEAADAVATFVDQRPVYVIRANGHDLGLVLRRFDLEALANPTLNNVWHVTGRRAPA